MSWATFRTKTWKPTPSKKYSIPIWQKQASRGSSGQSERKEKRSNRNAKYFKAVLNLNRIDKSISEQIKIRKGIDHYSLESKVLDTGKNAQPIYEDIESNLLSYNLYLKININKLDNFLEFQFTLYKYNSILNFALNIWANQIVAPTQNETRQPIKMMNVISFCYLCFMLYVKWSVALKVSWQLDVK